MPSAALDISRLEAAPTELPLPGWAFPELREAVRSAGGRLAIEGEFSAAERKVMRKRKRVPVSQWVERHRILTMSSVPGPWRNEVTPYLSGVMDASFFDSVQTIVICAAPQTGKSEAVNNCIGYAIDRDPGPVLYVYPDHATARENSRDRVQPMIKSSPRLAGYIRSITEDITTMAINLEHMPIYFAWSRSESRLANKPIRYLVLDETDKYQVRPESREADPVSLAEKRTTTYKWSRKTWKISSPTVESGYIWQALTLEAQAVYDFHVVCPSCGAAQKMEFERIKWPEGLREPEQMEKEKSARYECRDCQAPWDDEDRNRAVRAGRWFERATGLQLAEHLSVHRPVKIGFHIPAWLSWFVSLSECAAAFLRGLKSKTKLKDFKNNFCAEPWVVYEQVRQEDAILLLRDERPQGLVPAGGIVAALTAGIDTQDNGFWFEVRAWGFGLVMDSWQVRFGFVDSFAGLAEVLWGSDYLDAAGNRFTIRRALIDSGGHRTAEVYDFCRLHPRRIWASKGEGRMSAALHRVSKVDTYPGTTRLIPGGVGLVLLSVNQYKDMLATKLAVAAADPGAWRLCSDCSTEWAAQMTVEVIDEKTGLWINPKGRANHAWDCSVLNIAAADLKPEIRFWSKAPEAQPEPPREIKPAIHQAVAQRAAARTRRAGTWMGGL